MEKAKEDAIDSNIPPFMKQACDQLVDELMYALLGELRPEGLRALISRDSDM